MEVCDVDQRCVQNVDRAGRADPAYGPLENSVWHKLEGATAERAVRMRVQCKDSGIDA
jgi:hypothetical protein